MDPRSTVVILNPRAGGGRAERLWPMLRDALDATLGAYVLRRTQGPHDATRHARTALRRGADRIVAIGGDGTLNEVANGFFDADASVRPEAVLAPISCGTGSDFRRSLGGPRSPTAAVRALLQHRVRSIDVGRLQYTTDAGREAVRYFLNIASFGLGGAVDQVVETLPGKAQAGGRLAYLYAILHVLVRYRNQPVTMAVDGTPVYAGPISNVAVANGRFFGGGLEIAPEAQVDDGQLDVIVLGDFSRRALIRHARRFYDGTHLRLDDVSAFRGRCITATPHSDAPVRLDVDGEALGRLPATFTVRPRALRIQY
jgi:YegS/Rv2252/BmrU family lipid kinase